jgi:hypothetical protein
VVVVVVLVIVVVVVVVVMVVVVIVVIVVAVISLFHRAFQFTMCNGLTNALVCNKTLIQMSHIKTFKSIPTCFDLQLITIRELFAPG